MRLRHALLALVVLLPAAVVPGPSAAAAPAGAPAVAAAPPAAPAASSAPAPSAAPPGWGSVPDLERLCAHLKRTPSRTPLCTHGPDPLRAFGLATGPTQAPAAATAADMAPLCSDGGTSGRRIEVLYGVPQDRASRYSDVLGLMRDVLVQADRDLDASDAGTTQHFRFLCENGTDITIREVTLLPVGSDRSFDFWDYLDSLENQVALGLGPVDFTRDDRVYMTFVDRVGDVYGAAGEATVYLDDHPDPAVNFNNVGYARYALSTRFDAYVVAHEIGHTLGAVQLSAPHSSGAGHCHDGSDVMCYDDGGPYFADGGLMTSPCPVGGGRSFDCGQDDYYLPGRPPAGSYLATHWNIADSGFLTPAVGLADTVPPAISRRSPASAATGVPVGSVLTASFDEAVEGVSGTTFTLATAAGTPVPATVTYDAGTRLATLDPAADLSADTQYAVTVTGGATEVRDLAGNALATTTWTFMSGPAPRVTVRSPGHLATAVGAASTVSATFSEVVEGVSDSTFTLRGPSGAAVGAVVSYDPSTLVATLDPSGDLAPDTRYTVAVTGGPSAIRDLAGNPLASSTWTVTTGPAPVLTARSPGNLATAVAPSSSVAATFNEAVRGISGSTFTVRSPSGAAVAGTVTYNASTRVATLDPTTDLAADTRYTVTVTGGTSAVRDLAGNPLPTKSWTFTTGPAPTLTARSPGNLATGVVRTRNVAATFSEVVQGVSGSTFTLRSPSGAVVGAVVTYDAATRVATLNPNATLAARTTYRVTVTGGTSAIRDRAGNPLATRSWTFTTGS